jgi:hypothetical protein
MSEDYEILLHSNRHIILALSATEVGKIILPSNLIFTNGITGEVIEGFGKDPTVAGESEVLSHVNQLSTLMPKYIRQQVWQAPDGCEHQMMVMERLYPLPFSHFDSETRTKMFDVFESRVWSLHRKGFVHGDIVRPTNYYTRNDIDWILGNLVQTETELRLVDAAFGTIYSPDKKEIFRERRITEFYDLMNARAYYMAARAEPPENEPSVNLKN